MSRENFERNCVQLVEELSKVIKRELSRRYMDWRLLSKEDKEDLVMDIVQKVYEEYNKIWEIAKDEGNVDSYIISIVRNFLTDRQRKQDPIGYKIYCNLITVLKIMVEDGQLFCQKDLSLESVDKFTVFSFTRNEQSNSLPGANEIQKILKNSSQWDEFLKCLGKSGEKNLRIIALAILSMRNSGIVSFRFKDLLDAVIQETKELYHVMIREEKSIIEGIGEGIDILEFIEIVRQRIRNSLNRASTKEKMIKIFDYYYVRLLEGKDSPPLKEIARKLGLKQTNLSYYLKKLEKEILKPAYKEYYRSEKINLG